MNYNGSNGKLTGIRQIVRLKEILQKWQSVTLGSRASNPPPPDEPDQNHVIWQFMLDQSFGGLSFPLPILATPCSRCCWKRLRRSLGLIIVARSPYHAIPRLSSSLLSAWRPIRRLTLIRAQVCWKITNH
ncbi:hypothetical protein ACJW30_07G012400 [Castanea mollissima]